MKKFFSFCAILVAFMTAFTVNAQTMTSETYKNYAGEYRFFDNWSLGVEGGVQTNLHDWNVPQGGVAGLSLNKQITPEFGLSAEGYVGFNNTANWYDFNGVQHVHNGNIVENVNVFLTGRWNLMNTFGGYTGKPRVFEIETNVGAGYGHYFFNSNFGDDYNVLLGKAGLNFNFNLGSARAWTLSLKPAVVFNFTDATRYFNGSVANSKTAVFQATAGVTYHFVTSNKTHYIAASPVKDLVAYNAALNEEVNNLRAALAVVPAPVTTTVVEKEVVELVKLVDNTYVVTFAFDNAVLSDDAKANLDKIAAGSTVNVVAYASPEGASNYNKNLSLRRANAVADYLTARGVNVASIVGEGSVNAESNRIAIVTITE